MLPLPVAGESAIGKVEKISISLPAEMVQAVNKVVDNGQYATVSEVVREALRLWEVDRAENDRVYNMAVKTYGLQLLREMVQEGIDSGPGIDIDEAFAQVRAQLEQKWGKKNASRKVISGRATRSK